MDKKYKIKVFISYSHDTDEHKEFVLKLTEKLREGGVDCTIDQDSDIPPQGPPQGWTKWMMEMIERADFVLVMFTPKYAKSWRGESDGKGSTYEGAIITLQIYNNFGRNLKFIPVIRENGDRNDVQFPLNDFNIYTLMKGYDCLHSKLTGQFPQEKSVIQLKEETENTEESEDCPYQGLQAFKEENAEFFFGRDDFIHNQLIPAIERNSLPFISLFGASGVGKSSVVSAGLIPELKKDNWRCEKFEPGNDPFYSLAQTLIKVRNHVDQDHPGNEVCQLAEKLKERHCLSNYLAEIQRNLSQDEKLLIVIDHFEEIYREASDVKRRNSYSNQENQGYSFLRCLFDGIIWLKEKSQTNQIVFLAVTTSDGHSKTTDFLEFKGLYDPSAHIQLTGLTREEMRQVIVEPAKKKGVLFEKKENPEDDDLIDIILNDSSQESGMLPLLEVALRQLWQYKTDRLITKAAYKEIGGIRGALELHANRKINGLEENHQEIIKDIYLQLINAREDLIKTETIELRDVSKEELIAKDAKREKWIDFLVKQRLLVKHGPKHILSLPHKLLIEYWPKINDWLKQDASKRTFFNDLEKRAEKWRENGRKVNDLDSGLMLELTEKFLNENTNDFRLTDLMREFYKKGIINKKKNEWKKIAIIGIIIALLALLALLGISVVYSENEKQQADIKRQTAENEKQQAEIKRQIAENEKKQEELMHLGTQEQLVRAIKGKYLSSGEKTHFSPRNPEKRHGNDYFNDNEYEKAELAFKKSRDYSLDDPEALIYWNNAKAFLSKNYVTIVASVPIKYSNDIAKEMLRGIAQAQDEINSKGGIQGKLLHIAIADDNNDPADVEVIANYLINNYPIGDNNGKEVLAVIGSNVTEATKQAANIYQGKMVMISPTSFAVNISDIKKPENGKNYIFLAVDDYQVLMPKLVQHIKETNNHPKLFVCDDSKADDQRALRKYLNDEFSLIKVEKEDPCDLNNNKESYEKIVDKAIRSEIDSLFIAPHVSRINEGINLARYARSKKPDIKLYGSPTFYNATTLMNGEVTTDLVIPVHWHPEVSQKHLFYEEAKKLWGEQGINGITWRTAASYDAVFVISTALEKTNGKFNRESLQQQLADKDFEYEGALGEIQFQQNGTRKAGNSFLIKVKPCQENCPEGYKYSFYLTK